MTSTGNLTLSGDMFVPNGTAALSLTGNQGAYDTFVEANAISGYFKGNFTGDGPELSGGSGGATVSGGDSLTG